MSSCFRSRDPPPRAVRVDGSAPSRTSARSVAQEELVVEPPHPADWPRIAALTETYIDLPLGLVDSSVIAAAERLGTTRIATLDHRHFGVVRPRHVESFTLVP